jgi:hypothetical protein
MSKLLYFADRSVRATWFEIEPVFVGDPSQAARSHAGDAIFDSISVAEFLTAIFEKADERAVDVAEAEKTEIEGADACLLCGVVKQVPRRRCVPVRNDIS